MLLTTNNGTIGLGAPVIFVTDASVIVNISSFLYPEPESVISIDDILVLSPITIFAFALTTSDLDCVWELNSNSISVYVPAS